MGSNLGKEQATYSPEKNDLGKTLAGKWQLMEYEPEGCANMEDCNADFMLLKYYPDSKNKDSAGFDTFLRLVDKNSPGCGTLEADLTHVG